MILGTAGTGKTTLLLERLSRAAESGGRTIFLVPEQYSFEAELAVGRLLGPMLALDVEVLSFTRLCNEVFRSLGGLAGASVTQPGRYLLACLALSELRETLRVYKKSSASPAFLDMIIDAISELKTAGISPGRLEEIAAGVGKGQLFDKLFDLSAIYATFQALLEAGYTDPDDDLIRACRLIRESDIFTGAYVFVDGFTTFMAGEFELLELLISRAVDTTFAFTTDGVRDAQGGLGVFSPAKAAIEKLRQSARKASVREAVPVMLNQTYRYKSDELAHISGQFHLPEPKPYPESPRAISFFGARDIYREVEWVAMGIARLVRDEGYSYREIAVIARDTEPYLWAVQSVFLREDIPFFADSRREVENMPLAGGLLAALEAVRLGLDGGAVINYAKNPLVWCDPDGLAELEDYCYTWAVRGKLWENEWKNSPRGLANEVTAQDLGLLSRLNSMRVEIITPLVNLRESLRECDGRGFAAAVFDFIQEIDAAGNLVRFADSLPQGERETFLDEAGQLWDKLIEILDLFGGVLGSTTLQTARFIELLRLSLANAEIGLRPQTLDEVLVGGADRIRPGAVRAAFVIGGAQGHFPGEPEAGGVFTDSERQKVIDAGGQIGLPVLYRAVLERYYCYHALTIPSERLFVSYPLTNFGGADCRPSWMISRLRAIFPAMEEDKQTLTDQVYSTGGAYERLAAICREDTPQASALVEVLGRAGKADKIGKAAFKPSRRIEDAAVARRLFGERMMLSPTRVDRYYRCAFCYFARDGLGLRRPEKVSFSPLESGSILHHVLQVMTQRHGSGLFKMQTRQLRKEIDELINSYLVERVAEKQALPRRFSYLFERLGTTLIRLLRRLGEEFDQTLYTPVAFELPITQRQVEGGAVRPIELTTINGISVRVEGVVDRVDVMEKNGQKYLRVVDYKSGGKAFRLEDVICGLNLQMLIYLFTISENGQGTLGDCIPAGVLYMPLKGDYTMAERADSTEKIGEKHLRSWKMSGLLLDDEESIRGMEAELRGVFIPAKMGKDGWHKASALASKAEMGALSRKIDGLISEMADNLTRGNIPARPLRSKDFDPCEYCDFRPLCGFEQGDEYGSIPSLDKEKALSILRGEEND